jgi:hypothetical protein
MNSKTTLSIIAGLLVLALASTGAWYHAHEALRESRSQLVASTLLPIGELLKENRAIINELQAEPYAEKDNGVLESYLIRIRHDGVAKNVQMKQRLDQLTENNTAIVALIKAYTPQAKTPTFTVEADKFRSYASTWRDRWNSMMELFMAGGNYPAVGTPLPPGFSDAMQAEIAVAG